MYARPEPADTSSIPSSRSSARRPRRAPTTFLRAMRVPTTSTYGPSSPYARRTGSGSARGREALVDAVRHHATRSGVEAEALDQLVARELRGRDHAPGAPREQRAGSGAGRTRTTGEYQPGWRSAARSLMTTTVRREAAGREVGGAVDHPRLPGRGGQQGLLPEVPRPVGERAGRLHDRVAVGPQLGQPRGHLDRDPLDAADLAPCRGARVDDHRRVRRRLTRCRSR